MVYFQKNFMKRLYFSLVLIIVLAELALLVWVLASTIPLHPEKIYLQEDAAYKSFISTRDTTSPVVIVTEWLFFLVTAGVLIPVSFMIIGELIRWALGQRKTGSLGP